MPEEKKTPPPPPPAKAATADLGRQERITRIFCAIVDGPNHGYYIEQALKIDEQIAEACSA